MYTVDTQYYKMTDHGTLRYEPVMLYIDRMKTAEHVDYLSAFKDYGERVGMASTNDLAHTDHQVFTAQDNEFHAVITRLVLTYTNGSKLEFNLYAPVGE